MVELRKITKENYEEREKSSFLITQTSTTAAARLVKMVVGNLGGFRRRPRRTLPPFAVSTATATPAATTPAAVMVSPRLL